MIVSVTDLDKTARIRRGETDICLAAVNAIWVAMACYDHGHLRRHVSSLRTEIKAYRKPPRGNRQLTSKGITG